MRTVTCKFYLVEFQIKEKKASVSGFYENSALAAMYVLNLYTSAENIITKETGSEIVVTIDNHLISDKDDDNPKCPECLNTVSQNELDVFGGMCEMCTTGL